MHLYLKYAWIGTAVLLLFCKLNCLLDIFIYPFFLLLLSSFAMCREDAVGTKVVGDMLSSVVNAIGIQHR